MQTDEHPNRRGHELYCPVCDPQASRIHFLSVIGLAGLRLFVIGSTESLWGCRRWTKHAIEFLIVIGFVRVVIYLNIANSLNVTDLMWLAVSSLHTFMSLIYETKRTERSKRRKKMAKTLIDLKRNHGLRISPSSREISLFYLRSSFCWTSLWVYSSSACTGCLVDVLNSKKELRPMANVEELTNILPHFLFNELGSLNHFLPIHPNDIPPHPLTLLLNLLPQAKFIQNPSPTSLDSD